MSYMRRCRIHELGQASLLPRGMWIVIPQAGWVMGIRGKARGDPDFLNHKKNDSAKLRKASVSAEHFFHYGKSFSPTGSRGAEYPREGFGEFQFE